MRVAIIGGGLGGLCLAQALAACGVAVEVYERDPSPDARGQGYRLTINAQGASALAACAPPAILAYIRATAKRPPTGGGTFAVLDERARRLFVSPAVTASPAAGDGTEPALGQVDRAVLRRALLAGLGDRVRFGRDFTRYEDEGGDGVTLHFADGSCARADLLIGADGARSRVRLQRLPGSDAQPRETGVRGVFGRTLLRRCSQLSVLGEALASGGVLALAPSTAFFCTAMAFGEPPAAAAARLGLDASVAPPRSPADYVMWGVAYRRSDASSSNRTGGGMDGNSAFQHALRAAAGFQHPDFMRLLHNSEQDDCLDFPIWASQPPPASLQPSRVTLLGDAAHAMPPFGANGANTALRDAATLARLLAPAASTAIVRDQPPLIELIIARYETEMRQYSVRAASQALRMMELSTSPTPAVQLLTRTALRLAQGAVSLASALRRRG
jgi:2-polyprenyl-6-methoxyphenol hydroxylase-like FAD-dependent oxidoreductase